MLRRVCLIMKDKLNELKKQISYILKNTIDEYIKYMEVEKDIYATIDNYLSNKESKLDDRLNSCHNQIIHILDFYNCSLETDLYHSIWLYDITTGKTKNI